MTAMTWANRIGQNGIWTDRDGNERQVYGEAGEIWTSEAAMSRNDPSFARYEPTAWDDNGDETEWQVIDENRIAGVIIFPGSQS